MLMGTSETKIAYEQWRQKNSTNSAYDKEVSRSQIHGMR